MQHGFLRVLSCFCLTFAIFTAPAGDCFGQEAITMRPAGIIVSILPHKGKVPVSNVVVRSQGGERPVSEGDFISEGDEIIVPDRDQSVVISQRGSSATVCTASDATDRCRLIIAGGSVLSPLGRFYESIIRISRRMTTASSAASTLSSRDALDDAPLSITLDSKQPQRLQSGDRAIWLCWSGGDGPFQVRATMGTKLLAQRTSTEREITLPAIRVDDKPVVITIRDARGQKLALTILGIKAMPAMPAFSETASSEEINQFLKAGWLSQQENGGLKLEAVQRLTVLASTIHLADTLRRGLLIADE